MIEIFKFFKRKLKEGKPFDEYFAKLKQLIRSCKFNDQENKLLRTQIILGLSWKNTQDRLLREDHSLEKPTAICKSAELTEDNLKLLHNSLNVEETSRQNK